MAYLRAKIADLIDDDASFLRWKLTHGNRESGWYIARRATVTFPPATTAFQADAFLILETTKGENSFGPFPIPPLMSGAVLQVDVEIY